MQGPSKAAEVELYGWSQDPLEAFPIFGVVAFHPLECNVPDLEVISISKLMSIWSIRCVGTKYTNREMRFGLTF